MALEDEFFNTDEAMKPWDIPNPEVFAGCDPEGIENPNWFAKPVPFPVKCEATLDLWTIGVFTSDDVFGEEIEYIDGPHFWFTMENGAKVHVYPEDPAGESWMANEQTGDWDEYIKQSDEPNDRAEFFEVLTWFAQDLVPKGIMIPNFTEEEKQEYAEMVELGQRTPVTYKYIYGGKERTFVV